MRCAFQAQLNYPVLNSYPFLGRLKRRLVCRLPSASHCIGHVIKWSPRYSVEVECVAYSARGMTSAELCPFVLIQTHSFQSQTIMTMTRTRRKQKQEMVKRAVRDAEERQCEQRQLFRFVLMPRSYPGQGTITSRLVFDRCVPRSLLPFQASLFSYRSTSRIRAGSFSSPARTRRRLEFLDDYSVKAALMRIAH